MPEEAQQVTCCICKEQKDISEMIPGELIRDSIIDLIKKKYPEWTRDCFICIKDLNKFRAEYVKDVLEMEKGEITAIEEEVVRSLEKQELLSRNINAEFERRLTLGERASDKVAEFGGSWRFIFIFMIVLFVWIIFNSINILMHPFDPYPFIFLNLILSCIAAIQAPVIMMSQNRVEAKDRMRSEYDYKINLKAELEIRHLNEKIDHLLRNQWHRLLEIQEIQLELMEELAGGKPK
jgi:uncharacterized membrane protein